jgi:hypothetical protein
MLHLFQRGRGVGSGTTSILFPRTANVRFCTDKVPPDTTMRISRVSSKGARRATPLPTAAMSYMIADMVPHTSFENCRCVNRICNHAQPPPSSTDVRFGTDKAPPYATMRISRVSSKGARRATPLDEPPMSDIIPDKVTCETMTISRMTPRRAPSTTRMRSRHSTGREPPLTPTLSRKGKGSQTTARRRERGRRQCSPLPSAGEGFGGERAAERISSGVRRSGTWTIVPYWVAESKRAAERPRLDVRMRPRGSGTQANPPNAEGSEGPTAQAKCV